MQIAIAMLLTAFSHLGAKVWGQELVDRAVEDVVIFALEKYCAWTHTTVDDEFLAFVKMKLGRE